MHQGVLHTVVVVIVLGIAAQLVAHRFKLPAILPLLILGTAAGPHGLAFFSPELLGSGLEVFIHLGVAIILFEGGLSVDLRQLRRESVAVRNLLSLGVLTTAVGAALLARWLTGISWEIAALFGAIVTVTGPTVIAPLLRHMIAPRSVRTILLSEGLMIDPIGAVLAYLVLQWIELRGLELRALAGELAEVFLTGAIIGFAAAAAAHFLARHRRTGAELRNLAILAVLLGAYQLAEAQAPQSGIVAAVVMGLTLTGLKPPDLEPLKSFKGQLTVLVISVLFILLSGQLDLGAVVDLDWAGAAVAGGLVLLVRPLSVAASVATAGLGWKERLVLALTAPRGIVAAAVASLAAIRLRAGGAVDEATILEGLVYVSILATCTWATLMAVLLPRLLGYLHDPARRLAVLVGAGPLSHAVAGAFIERGWTAAIVDGDRAKLADLRAAGLRTIRGDARDAATYERAGVERDSQVIALTTNDELNLLVAQLVRDEFGVEHPVVALQRPSEEFGRVRRAWIDLLTGGRLDLGRWASRLRAGRARVTTIPVPPRGSELKARLEEPEEAGCAVLCSWQDGRPIFHPEPDADAEAWTLLIDHAAEEILTEVETLRNDAPHLGDPPLPISE